MITFRVIKRGATPKVAKRRLNDIHRDGMQQWGEDWRDKYRPKHFRNLASTEYDYTPRQGERGRPYKRGFEKSYTGRKLKEYGHTRPLVLTGESEAISRNPNITATAKSGGAQVRIAIPAYKLNFRYAGSPIDMRAELTRVTQIEAAELAAGFRDFLAEKYGQINDQSTTTIEG